MRLNNNEFVAELMNHNVRGPLVQMFIIEAISRYAKQVAEAPPMEHELINGDAWKQCAADVHARIEQQYRGRG